MQPSSLNTSDTRSTKRRPKSPPKSIPRKARWQVAVWLMVPMIGLLPYYWSVRYQHMAAECIRDPHPVNKERLQAFNGYPTPVFSKPITSAISELSRDTHTQQAELDRLRAELTNERESHALAISGLVDSVSYAVEHDFEVSNLFINKALNLQTDETARSALQARLKPKPTFAKIDGDTALELIELNGNSVMFACNRLDGSFIENLSTADFQVIDSEQRVWPHFTVRERPGGFASSSVIVLVDRSLSMEGKRIEQLKSALHRLVDEVTSKSKMQIVAFDHKVQPVTELTNDVAILRGSIDKIQPEGATAIADALEFALKQLSRVEGHKLVLLCTDGEDQALRMRISEITSKFLSANVPVNVLAIEHGKLDKPTLETLANSTFGCFSYADTPQSIVDRMDSIVKCAKPSYLMEVFVGGKPLSGFSFRLRDQPSQPIRLAR